MMAKKMAGAMLYMALKNEIRGRTAPKKVFQRLV